MDPQGGVPEGSGGAHAIWRLDAEEALVADPAIVLSSCLVHDDLNHNYSCLEIVTMPSPSFSAIELKRSIAVHETTDIVITINILKCA